MRRSVIWMVLSTLLISAIFAGLIYANLGRIDPKTPLNLNNIAAAMATGIIALALNAWLVYVFSIDGERHPKNKSLGQAFKNLRKPKVVGMATWEVKDGKLTETHKVDGTQPKTAKVIVPKDYAIVFEDKTGKFTHAEFGPVEIESQPADHLAASIVIPTRPRFKRLTLQNVAMKDGIALERIDFSIYYHLKTDESQYHTENIQYPIAQDTLTQAVYGVAFGEDDQHHEIKTWDDAVQESAKFFLRSEVSGVAVVEIYTRNGEAAPIRRIADQAKKRLNESAEKWGVIVETLEVTHVAIPERIQKKLEEEWLMFRSQEVMKSEGIAEGKKIEEVEQAKTRAWQQMVVSIRQSIGDKPSSTVIATRYIQMMQYLDSLVKMTQSSPNKTVLYVPQQGEGLYKDFDDRLLTMMSDEDKQERTFVEDKGGDVKIVGEEEEPPEKKDDSDDDAAAMAETK